MIPELMLFMLYIDDNNTNDTKDTNDTKIINNHYSKTTKMEVEEDISDDTLFGLMLSLLFM